MMTRKYFEQPYVNREQRNEFIANDFDEFFISSVLNIGGGGKNNLKRFLKEDITYFEIDIDGEPDLKIDIDKCIPIPIEDKNFDTVVCTEVLEHLENMHEIFGEMVRIAKKYIILSLPNSLMSVYSYFRNKKYMNDTIESRKKYGRYRKFYGLPYEKPVDRHRWFFSYTEAEDFLHYQAEKYNLSIKEMFGIGYYHHKVNKRIMRLLINLFGGEDVRKNFSCSTLWCVLEKKVEIG